ncbi:hypothetical protein J3F84DRAFT_159151 [Trichoderma pleuroticola]
MPESPPQLLFPGHAHPTKPPLAPGNENSPLESLPACVRAWTCTCISGDGVLGAGWADSQRSIAGCLSYLKTARSPLPSSLSLLLPPFPISMQEEWKRGPRTDGVREDRYILVRTVHARSLQCKAASKKNTWKRLCPPVAPFNAIRQAVSQQGLAFGTKFANFICRASSIASQVPLRVRSSRNPHWHIHYPYPYRTVLVTRNITLPLGKP